MPFRNTAYIGAAILQLTAECSFAVLLARLLQAPYKIPEVKLYCGRKRRTAPYHPYRAQY